jgi:hypothetical protein
MESKEEKEKTEEAGRTVFWSWSLPFVVVMAVLTRGSGDADEESFEN